MIALLPAGANGVLLKLKLPHSCMYEDNFGFILEVHSMHKVIISKYMSLSHWFAGNVASAPFRIEMRWFLNVLIALSAGLSW